MLEIKQFRYRTDNLGYLLSSGSHALVIDGGAVDEIDAYLKQAGRTLKIITNTHTHEDHVCGNWELARRTSATFVDHRAFAAQGYLSFEGLRIEVIAAPGHTEDSVLFAVGHMLFTGDTLLNGTVGNCYFGDLGVYFDTLKRALALPDGTVVYGGHDYVHRSMEEARRLEPSNPHFGTYLANYDPRHIVSTLGEERRVNPYLRFNEPEIVGLLQSRGMPVATELERFASLMQLD